MVEVVVVMVVEVVIVVEVMTGSNSSGNKDKRNIICKVYMWCNVGLL